jgi:hypothetical protein
LIRAAKDDGFPHPRDGRDLQGWGTGKVLAGLRLPSALYPHYGDLLEALFKHRGLQFLGHLAHYVLAHRAIALAVALQANLKWYIKKYRLRFVAEAFGHLDPLAAFVNGQIGGVHIVPGHPRNQACSQERAQCGKDQALIALLLNVVEKNVAQQVARQGRYTATPEPGCLSRAGQPYGQHYITLGSLG